jgi:hypothetical protein
MERSLEAIAPSYDRPLIIKVGDHVDMSAMAEADSEPVALYYRNNTAESTFPLRTVMLIALFVGGGGAAGVLIRFAVQRIAQMFGHFAGG